ncbi:hypothetical protein K458DRAFT_348798 [Lentithecium fluviatile CBS 122367]|uniref:Uncharacterized protein n=1 Tax=Lentithecium fluviatile CBS 122367 TaxID=1168545 RepID=A0A6G1IJP3_9PLEO|nr:hypothetical protein K458DRAFT_348798 [Lentithecium fluviatile CBS 122367]
MSLPSRLAMSASKTDVLTRLGLSGSHGEGIYKLMLEEAAKGRDRLSYNPANLTNHSKADPMVQPPYKWDELNETARHNEVLNIAAQAGSYTRTYFQLGRYTTPVAEENWVAQWFLWHCFRYRDNRPRAAAAAGERGNSNGGNADGRPYWGIVLGNNHYH